MATLDELHAALQKADAAGDTEAAREIAKMYAAQQSSGQQTQAGGADTYADSKARGLPSLKPNVLGFPSPMDWQASHARQKPTLGGLADTAAGVPTGIAGA